MTINVVKRNGTVGNWTLKRFIKWSNTLVVILQVSSESQVEMNANLQFFDGIETSDIQEILIRSANDLISLDSLTINTSPHACCYFLSVSRSLESTQTPLRLYEQLRCMALIRMSMIKL